MFFKNRLEINLLMEIYKDLSSPASKEFEKLLNSQLSKENIEGLKDLAMMEQMRFVLLSPHQHKSYLHLI